MSSLIRKIAFSSGSFAYLLGRNAVAMYAQFVYSEVYKLSPGHLSVAWTVYGIVCALSEPLLGMLSDRTRTRFGRRRVWVVGAFPLWILTHGLLWLPPFTTNPAIMESWLGVYFSCILIVHGIADTIIGLNYGSLVMEMFTDTESRTAVLGIRTVFSVAGLLVGMPLMPLLLGAENDHIDRMAYVMCLALSTFAFALFSVQEKAIPAPVGTSGGFFSSIARMFVVLWTHTSFFWFVFSTFFVQLGQSLQGALFSLFCLVVLKLKGGSVDVWGVALDPSAQIASFLFSSYGMSLVATPLWLRISRNLGHRSALLGGLLSNGIACALLALIPGQYWIMLAASALLGVTLTPIILFRDALLGDVVDESVVLSPNKPKAGGTYIGINGLMMRLSSALQGTVLGVCFMVAGYDSSVEIVSDWTLSMLRFSTTLLPAVFMLIAAAALFFMPWPLAKQCTTSGYINGYIDAPGIDAAVPPTFVITMPLSRFQTRSRLQLEDLERFEAYLQDAYIHSLKLRRRYQIVFAGVLFWVCLSIYSLSRKCIEHWELFPPSSFMIFVSLIASLVALRLFFTTGMYEEGISGPTKFLLKCNAGLGPLGLRMDPLTLQLFRVAPTYPVAGYQPSPMQQGLGFRPAGSSEPGNAATKSTYVHAGPTSPSVSGAVDGAVSGEQDYQPEFVAGVFSAQKRAAPSSSIGGGAAGTGHVTTASQRRSLTQKKGVAVKTAPTSPNPKRDDEDNVVSINPRHNRTAGSPGARGRK